MSERGLHLIEDDLSETWVEDWAAVGLSEIEALLAKHAAFLGYLEDRLRVVGELGVCHGAGAETLGADGADSFYRGTPGHPLHPPLTDATIGIYTFATVAAG